MLYCMKNYFALNSTHPQFHTKFSRIRFPYRDHHIIIINCNGQSMIQTTSYHTQAGRPASLAWTWPASVIWDALWHVRLSYVTERESTDLWNTYVILNWHQRARQGILRSSAFSAWFSPISQKLSLISKVWAILHCQSRGICTVELKTQPFWLLLPVRKARDCLTLSPTACTSPQRYKSLFKKQSFLKTIHSFRETIKWSSTQMQTSS